jgi:hypothetical protein
MLTIYDEMQFSQDTQLLLSLYKPERDQKTPFPRPNHNNKYLKKKSRG